jgi:hypothetical protein
VAEPTSVNGTDVEESGLFAVSDEGELIDRSEDAIDEGGAKLFINTDEVVAKADETFTSADAGEKPFDDLVLDAAPIDATEEGEEGSESASDEPSDEDEPLS